MMLFRAGKYIALVIHFCVDICYNVLMKIIKLSNQNYSEIVEAVSKVVSSGGVAVVPFDTVYGLICDPRSEIALRNLFEIKRRPVDKTIGLAVPKISNLEIIARLDLSQSQFIKDKTPGRYTFILPLKDTTISKLCVQNQTVGVRIPDSDLVRDIADKAGGVIAQTSANKSGFGNTFSISDILLQYNEYELSEIDIIVDGGAIKSVAASEIVDLTDNSFRRIERK